MCANSRTGLVTFALRRVFENIRGCQSSALDFNSLIPFFSYPFPGVAQGAVSPPVALQMGMGILCQLFQVWDQVTIGMITLTEWLLGDNQAELVNEKTLDLVRTQIVRHIL